MLITERNKLGTLAVSLDEAKSWLRVDSNEDDTLINTLIESAEFMFEDVTGMFVTEEEVKLTSTDVELRLPFLPASTITSVDENGDAEEFEYDAGFGYIKFEDDSEHNITYAGKGDIASYKTVILQIIALLYENRGDVNADVDISKVNGIDKYINKQWV